MRTLMIAPALMLALSACGGEPARNDAVNVAVPAEDDDVSANEVGNQLDQGNQLAAVLALNDRQRNAVFIRALIDANLPCETVTGSERVADREGLPVWRVTCSGRDNQHMITITPDGTANIVSRSD